jgi:hypothetical protein
VFRLADLLSRMPPDLGREILLRGGTALNLLYLDVPRLSVDIDLDFVGNPDSNEAQRRRPQLLDSIERIASRAGYEVRSERPSYAISHQRMHYTNAFGRPAFLKMDINFLDRVPVMPQEERTLRHPFGDDLAAASVQTFALEELAASKLIALVRRAAARDLFDAAMLSNLGEIDMAILKTLVVIRGASYPPPFPDSYDPAVVESIRLSSWRSEVMALGQRPLPVDFAEAKELARRLLEGVSELYQGHLEFLQSLNEGEIRANSLEVPDRSRVISNPGLLWRLRVGAQALEDR